MEKTVSVRKFVSIQKGVHSEFYIVTSEDNAKFYSDTVNSKLIFENLSKDMIVLSSPVKATLQEVSNIAMTVKIYPGREEIGRLFWRKLNQEDNPEDKLAQLHNENISPEQYVFYDIGKDNNQEEGEGIEFEQAPF